MRPAQGPWEGTKAKKRVAGTKVISRAKSFGLKSCRNALLFSIAPLTCQFMWKCVKAPVCHPFPRTSFRAWRGCSACPKRQHLWYLLEDRASYLSHQKPRKLMHKLKVVVWFAGISPLVQSPSKATSRYLKTNLNKLSI